MIVTVNVFAAALGMYGVPRRRPRVIQLIPRVRYESTPFRWPEQHVFSAERRCPKMEMFALCPIACF